MTIAVRSLAEINLGLDIGGECSVGRKNPRLMQRCSPTLTTKNTTLGWGALPAQDAKRSQVPVLFMCDNAREGPVYDNRRDAIPEPDHWRHLAVVGENLAIHTDGVAFSCGCGVYAMVISADSSLLHQETLVRREHGI